jgi:RNA polymerase sigma-70 factor, ECF subfamily
MAYMRQVLVNKIRDEARRSRSEKQRQPMPEGMLAREPSPLEEAVGSDLLQAYDRGLGELTEAQREAVILRVEFGYTYAEIAEATEAASVDAARMLVVRGLERLTEAMHVRP